MDREVRAAMDLWTPLAADAWEQFLAQGRGVLLVDRDDLLAAHAAGDDAEAGRVATSFVPLAMIPKGDDFRPLLAQYDPARQVMLLVRDADGEERMLTLQSDGVTRPAPEACYQSRVSRG